MSEPTQEHTQEYLLTPGQAAELAVSEPANPSPDRPDESAPLAPAVVQERLRRGAANAAALDEQLKRVFGLREQSATLKLTSG